MSARWDLFCRVVDNFGDAGVAWRLARQLAREHALGVRLWIDAPRALARIAPAVDPAHAAQRVDDVEIRTWPEPFPQVAAADVVVEAFGCGIPDGYAEAMARRKPHSAWFVLEYLSAEAWIDGAHALPSPHPRLPLVRRFWFPGFTPASGGLPRERGLIEARDAHQRDPAAVARLWGELGLPPTRAGELRVSLFCYPNPTLPALFDAWADGDDRIACVVPDGAAAGALDTWTSGNVPRPGHPSVRGRLALHAIPFLAQDDYDRLLWSCDANFVRGEDSFARAQWAARPFAWHIYPQAGDAHVAKLDAFLDRFCAGLDLPAAVAMRRFHQAWNGVSGRQDIGDAWREFAARRAPLSAHAQAWGEGLARHPDLASGLVSAAAVLV
jgi:uncharacterized repeat protein (TIGR03837 family)